MGAFLGANGRDAVAACLSASDPASGRPTLKRQKPLGFERVGQLPQIDRRRVEICRALASRPRLLLLDEPSAGMNPEETAELMRDLGVVREELPGLSMIVIEHDMFVIEGVSQRVVALNYGRKIAEGPFAVVAAHAEVREAYLGRESARA